MKRMIMPCLYGSVACLMLGIGSLFILNDVPAYEFFMGMAIGAVVFACVFLVITAFQETRDRYIPAKPFDLTQTQVRAKSVAEFSQPDQSTTTIFFHDQAYHAANATVDGEVTFPQQFMTADECMGYLANMAHSFASQAKKKVYN